MNEKIKNMSSTILLKYGISAILFILVLFIVWILNTISIKNKTCIDIIKLSDNCYIGYILNSDDFEYDNSSTISVWVDNNKLIFKIDSITQESQYYQLALTPIDAYKVSNLFNGNSRQRMDIIVGESKLWELILHTK